MDEVVPPDNAIGGTGSSSVRDSLIYRACHWESVLEEVSSQVGFAFLELMGFGTAMHPSKNTRSSKV
jgi:hypothetical protein